ncbi:MAG TPA: hypothetical protein VH879_02765 [Gemmatimonadales bacterium]|jgi:hypothetical protein
MRLVWCLGSALRSRAVLGVALALGACSEDVTGPRPVPTSMSLAAGNDQQGTVGQPLDTALTVFVADKFGDPVPGVLVRFALSGRSGSLTPLAQTTSPSGHAHSTWSLPTSAGAYFATATAAGLDSLTFRATALPAAPATLTLVAGDSQVALEATAPDSAVTVLVEDGFGNPVRGVNVSFTPLEGSGIATPEAVRSDSAGLARTVWTLGAQAGVHALIAKVDSLPVLRIHARALHQPPTSEIGMATGYGAGLPPEEAVITGPGAAVPLDHPVYRSATLPCWQNALGSVELLPDTAALKWSGSGEYPDFTPACGEGRIAF